MRTRDGIEPSNPVATKAQLAEFDKERSGRHELLTPPQWAEKFGYTGLVEEEWQHVEQIRTWKAGRESKYLTDPRVAWERPISQQGFVELAQGKWRDPSLDRSSPYHYGKKRSGKPPRFAPTEEAIVDLLADAGKWTTTVWITDRLIANLGLGDATSNHRSKVVKVLEGLVEQDRVVRYRGPGAGTTKEIQTVDHVGPHADRNNVSAKWCLTEQLDQWRIERDAFYAEDARRQDLVVGFDIEHTAVTGGRGLGYGGAKAPVYNGEPYDNPITFSWPQFERLVNKLKES
jgi:hypothetical protein